MVPQLADIVEDTVLSDRRFIVGSDDDVLKAFAVPFRACDELVAVVDIGFVVQIVVVFEGLGGHAVSGERVVSVR